MGYRDLNDLIASLRNLQKDNYSCNFCYLILSELINKFKNENNINLTEEIKKISSNLYNLSKDLDFITDPEIDK